MRTQPEENDLTIKDIYFNATRVAAAGTGYLYIENQYFQYKEWADHLLEMRKNVISGWNRGCSKINKTKEDLPILYVFLVIPIPELSKMIPRTYDTLATLGQETGLTGQVKLINNVNNEAELKSRLPKKSAFGDSVDRRANAPIAVPAIDEANRIHKPTIDELRNTYGLQICVVVLNSEEYNQEKRQWRYREIYIHSKLLLVDDSFITIGSANLNQRSMVVDSEINLATNDPRQARPLRQAIWSQLTGGKHDGGNGTIPEIKETHLHWIQLALDNKAAQKQKSKDPKRNKMSGLIVPLDDSRFSVLRLG